MEYKKIKNDEYTLHLINTDRFKTINVVLFLTKTFDSKDLANAVLLNKNMVYSSKKYNTKNKMAMIGEELFGAKVSSSFGVTGESQVFTFSLDFLNPNYTVKKYIKKSLEFFKEILFNPNVKDGKFDSGFFNIIKNDTINVLKSAKDNPNRYSSMQYAKLMYKGTSGEYSSNPEIEDVQKVTESSLYKFYNRLFSGEYKVDIVIHGEIDDDIVNEVKDTFKNIKGSKNEMHFTVDHKYKDKLIESVETLPFKQSRLIMGYRLNELTYHEMNHVLKVYNTILGTMNDSILFNIVREKNSLCYSIGSYTSRYNPSLTIYAGINKDNYENAVSLIKKCVDMMSDKKVVESLINYALKTINTYLNNYYDDVSSQINKYYASEFETIEDTETLRDNINNVTVEEIVELNKKISLSVIYLLKGE